MGNSYAMLTISLLADIMTVTMIAIADKNHAKHKFYIVESHLCATDRYSECLLPGHTICAWTRMHISSVIP